MSHQPAAKLRIDKWLWHARFFKTRSLASKQVGAGHVRLNGQKISKPSQNVSLGDVLTFAQAKQIRVVRVDALGERRGPASEALELYTDLAPPTKDDKDVRPQNPRFEGKGRPDKKARRALDLSRAKDMF